MKTIKEVISSRPMYLDGWKRKNIENDFEVKLGKDIKILLAKYSSYSYEGEAFVLFTKGGRLYEVHGSHCSCYGLEGQWDPEPVNIKEMKNRLINGNLGDGWYEDGKFNKELAKLLGVKLKEKKDE